jgi:hypothetical protein
MDNLRRFPAPWVMEEEEGSFRVKDANGFSLCSVVHRQDLHDRSYQYAEQFLTHDEDRRGSEPAAEELTQFFLRAARC